MTLTDKENNEIVEQTSDMPLEMKLPTMDIGESLQTSLTQARDQGRVTCGVYQCTQLLQIEPTEVMVCILPENVEGDVSMHIHFTLLEAFCWENGIRIIKIDDAAKLTVAMVTGGTDNDVTQQRARNAADCSCILIEYPQNEPSAADEDVLEYYKTTCDVYPQPVVELPG